MENLSKNRLIILHSEWIWANYLKIIYEATLRSSPKEILLDPMKFFVNQPGCYMMLWYALLFSVLENLKSWGAKVNGVEDEIKEIYLPLKKLRNAVFHSPKIYWDARWFAAIEKKDAGAKIRRIHDAMGQKFLDLMSADK